LKNWASKGYGATGLFKEYPKSWNNVATAVSGMNKFKGNGVTANNLKRVFPVYATNYEKFLKKRFHYERPANKPETPRGRKGRETAEVGKKYNNPLFVPNSSRSRMTQLTTEENKFPKGPKKSRKLNEKSPNQVTGTFLNRLERKMLKARRSPP
jgi:hypothetical protein